MRLLQGQSAGPQALELRDIRKEFGRTRALDGISFDVAPGELVSILGASGSGKSTLLRVVAGLEKAGGSVMIGGRPVNTLAPKERGVAFVFQSYALYPHMDVQANLAAPLVMQALPATDRMPILGRLMPGARSRRAGIAQRVQATAELLQIEGLLRRKPSQLSGGQRQRVALGRALIREPGLFLLDEPLANLDAALRHQTRSDLRTLQQRLGTTTLFVTHDQAEAMAISDRIAVMVAGRLRQIATPDDLYRRPLDIDVARFLSQPVLNAWTASADRRGIVEVSGERLRITGAQPGQGVLAFRPQHAHLVDADEGGPSGIAVAVERSEHGGADAYVAVTTLASRLRATVRVPSAQLGRWRPNAVASLLIDQDHAWFFPGAQAEVPTGWDRSSLDRASLDRASLERAA